MKEKFKMVDEETKIIHEYLVKLGNIQEPIKCRITETKNEELPFSYEAEFISELESIECKTHYEAFTNLTKHLAELIEPHQINENH
jgi:hypothetical protein